MDVCVRQEMRPLAGAIHTQGKSRAEPQNRAKATLAGEKNELRCVAKKLHDVLLQQQPVRGAQLPGAGGTEAGASDAIPSQRASSARCG